MSFECNGGGGCSSLCFNRGHVQDCEVLEMETKRFEDLEFQQLERESRQDEEKESHTQQLLREMADYQRSTVNRKASDVACAFEKNKHTIVMSQFLTLC